MSDPSKSYPDIEQDEDMLCPNCKRPEWALHVASMESEYDEYGRFDYVTAWGCDNCDHEFSEDDALSIRGMIEDEETDETIRLNLVKWVQSRESECT